MSQRAGRQTTLFQTWGYEGNIPEPPVTPMGPPPGRAGRPRPSPSASLDFSDNADEDDALLSMALDESVAQHRFDSALARGDAAPPCLPTATPQEDLPGFDVEAGRSWVYPINYPLRTYQYDIVKACLFQNTLVTLPTGLGKTFIAAVVMYNFFRWYPSGKVVFMAPTKPLVGQQIEACFNIMGIPQIETMEMTGNVAIAIREKAWQQKRVLFMTPQVMSNDLSRGLFPARQVKLLVVDEAHRAQGDYAYCQVVKELSKIPNPQFRVVALSATPGSDIQAVRLMLQNLMISHIELRSEDSPDIVPYTFERTIQKIVIPLGDELLGVKNKFLTIMEHFIRRLAKNGALSRRGNSANPTHYSKFGLLQARNEFRQNPPARVDRSTQGVVEGDFASSISLYHAYELLLQHGMRTFFNFLNKSIDEQSGNRRLRYELNRLPVWQEVLSSLLEKFSEDPKHFRLNSSRPHLLSQFGSARDSQEANLVLGHPKLEKLRDMVVAHFQTKQAEGLDTKVMIFSQYRDSVQEITACLHSHRPLIKVMEFVGQAGTKGKKGLSQRDQIEVVRRFRTGGFNTLVATCVGEEGLDIGEVDLIVCFDVSKSPIRLVQRMGRTGRKRAGRIIVLVTEGKEEQTYNQSMYSKNAINKAILEKHKLSAFLAPSPRMIPRGINPICHKMSMIVRTFQSTKPSKRSFSDANSSSRIDQMLDGGRAGSFRRQSGFLTPAELQIWQEKYHVPEETVPVLRGRAELWAGVEPTPSIGREFDLSEWLLWQDRKNTRFHVGQSTTSRMLSNTLAFIAQDLDFSCHDAEMKLWLEDESSEGGKARSRAPNAKRPCPKERRPNLVLDMFKRQEKDEEEVVEGPLAAFIAHDEVDEAEVFEIVDDHLLNDDMEIGLDEDDYKWREFFGELYKSLPRPPKVPLPPDITDIRLQIALLSQSAIDSFDFGQCSNQVATIRKERSILINPTPVPTHAEPDDSASLPVSPIFKSRGTQRNHSPATADGSAQNWERSATPSFFAETPISRPPKQLLAKHPESDIHEDSLNALFQDSSIDVVSSSEVFHCSQPTELEPPPGRVSRNGEVEKEGPITRSDSMSKDEHRDMEMVFDDWDANLAGGNQPRENPAHHNQSLYSVSQLTDMLNQSGEGNMRKFEFKPDIMGNTSEKDLFHMEGDVDDSFLANLDMGDTCSQATPEKDYTAEAIHFKVPNPCGTKCSTPKVAFEVRRMRGSRVGAINLETRSFFRAKEAPSMMASTQSSPVLARRQKSKRSRPPKLDISSSEEEHESPLRKEMSQKKEKKRRRISDFLETEAQLSGEDDASGDEVEEGSDGYEASFVNDDPGSQSVSEDQRLAYLRSLRSPKLAKPRTLRPITTDIFSQVPEPDELGYEADSFCVGSDEDEEEEPARQSQMNTLDLIETDSPGRVLAQPRGVKARTRLREQFEQYYGRKRDQEADGKRRGPNGNTTRNTAIPDEGKKRIVTGGCVSSSDDETSILRSPDGKPTSRKTLNKSTTKARFTQSVAFSQDPFTSGTVLGSKRSQPVQVVRPDLDQTLEDEQKPTVLINSSEVHKIPGLISSLKHEHGFAIHVRAFEAAAVLLSPRTAVDRIMASEFSNGANRHRILEKCQKMNDLFERPCVIIEADRKEDSVPRNNRTKYFDLLLSQLSQSKILFFFTGSQVESASVLGSLLRREEKRKFILPRPLKISPLDEAILKFYQTLPGVGLGSALELLHGFAASADLMKAAPATIMHRSSLSEKKSREIHAFLRKQFEPSLTEVGNL